MYFILLFIFGVLLWRLNTYHNTVEPKFLLSAGCSFHNDTSHWVALACISLVTNSMCLCFYRMSSVDVNDENRGVCPAGKHSSSSNDIFAIDQPTGRPSILRQTENLPSKAVPKGAKVS